MESDEAKGQVKADGEEKIPATPDNTVTGTPGENEDPNAQTPEPDVLKYSDRTLEAAREAARDEGRNLATSERAERERERRHRLVTQVSDTDAGPAPVIRGVETALRNLAPTLTADEMEPVVKFVRDARATIEDAAFIVVAESYKDSINAGLGSSEKVKAFWEHAAGLDADLDVATVLPLFAEEMALGTKAVRTADPEALIAANPKLKEHMETYGDSRWEEGRLQGQVDPKGEVGAEGKNVQSSITPSSLKGRSPRQIADDLRDPARRAALATAVKTATRR